MRGLDGRWETAKEGKEMDRGREARGMMTWVCPALPSNAAFPCMFDP